MTLLQKAADFFAGGFDFIGRTFARHGTFAFLDARQEELGGVERMDLAAAIYACAAIKSDFTFVQIGAYDGKSGDPLGECIRKLGLRGVLVEPQQAAFDALRAHYADQPQLAFERAVIAAEDGSARFYRADPDFWRQHIKLGGSGGEVASLDPGHVRRHVAQFGGERLASREEAYLRWDDLPALTLGTLQAKHGIGAPDLIQIDAEGFDYEILKMIDWSQRPALIHYETLHLAVPERIAAWQLLRDKSYKLYETDSYNTLAIRVPIV
ncbi:MAG: FkbM family methyltransferase [Novosphingobium sp.]